MLIPAKIFCDLRSLRIMWWKTRPIVLLLCSPPDSSIPAALAKTLVDLAALTTAISSATLAFFENGSIAEGGLGCRDSRQEGKIHTARPRLKIRLELLFTCRGYYRKNVSVTVVKRVTLTRPNVQWHVLLENEANLGFRLSWIPWPTFKGVSPLRRAE